MDQGSRLFILYAFLDFLCIMVLLTRILVYGAAANYTQSLILKILYQLKKDQVQLQNMTNQDIICLTPDESKSKKDRLVVLSQINKEGWYRCKKTDKTFESLENFTELNQELEERL